MSNMKPTRERQIDRDLQEIIRKAKMSKRGVTIEKRLDSVESWITQYGDVLRTLLAQQAS